MSSWSKRAGRLVARLLGSHSDVPPGSARVRVVAEVSSGAQKGPVRAWVEASGDPRLVRVALVRLLMEGSEPSRLAVVAALVRSGVPVKDLT